MTWEQDKEFYSSGRHLAQMKEYHQRLADDAMYNLKLGILNLVSSGVDQTYWDKLMDELADAYKSMPNSKRTLDVYAAIQGKRKNAVANTVPVPASIPKPGKVPVFNVMVCKSCNDLNEFAEANQPDGSYVCYACR